MRMEIDSLSETLRSSEYRATDDVQRSSNPKYYTTLSNFFWIYANETLDSIRGEETSLGDY
jgi:hypothetical protein